MAQWFKRFLGFFTRKVVSDSKLQLDFDVESIKKDMIKNYVYLYEYQGSNGFRVFLDQIIKARNIQIIEVARQGNKLKDTFELGKQLGRLEALNDIVSGIELSFMTEKDKREKDKKVPGERKIVSTRRTSPAVQI